jgi:phosphate transport system substrate-binding protein
MPLNIHLGNHFMKTTSVTLAASSLVFAAAVASAGEVRLQGAGATFPNPLYQKWVSEFQKSHPDVKIDYQSIGSGGGIKAITEKTVHFAGSDAPLSKKELAALGENNVVQVPSCAGAVVPAYNLPEVKEAINFSGEVLADIYAGKITKWNDAKLASLNPGVKLPDLAITPAWRSDGSGTTFVFTNFLATQSESFKGFIGTGKQVQWPMGQGGKGNEGVAATVQGTTGSIGYIELNYAVANKISFGAVQNKAGKFVKASTEAVSAAGANAAGDLRGNVLAANIWNQPGETSYPIASFTYLIVYKDLGTAKSAEEAKALTDFIGWCMNDGQKYAQEMEYAPIAPSVKAKVDQALQSIAYKPAK